MKKSKSFVRQLPEFSTNGILYMLAILLSLSGFSSCNINLKRQETGHISKEEVLKNKQQKQFPFNEKAVDQIIRTKGEIPPYDGLLKHRLPNGISSFIMSSKSQEGSYLIELMINTTGKNKKHCDLAGRAALIHSCDELVFQMNAELINAGFQNSLNDIYFAGNDFLRFRLKLKDENAQLLPEAIAFLATVIQNFQPDSYYLRKAIEWKSDDLLVQRKNKEVRNEEMPDPKKIASTVKALMEARNIQLILIGDVDQNRVLEPLDSLAKMVLLTQSGPKKKAESPFPSETNRIIVNQGGHDMYKIELKYFLRPLSFSNQLELRKSVIKELILRNLKRQFQQVRIPGYACSPITIQSANREDYFKITLSTMAAPDSDVKELAEVLHQVFIKMISKEITEREIDATIHDQIKEFKSAVRESSSRTLTASADEMEDQLVNESLVWSKSQWYGYFRSVLPRILNKEVNEVKNTWLKLDKPQLTITSPKENTGLALLDEINWSQNRPDRAVIETNSQELINNYRSLDTLSREEIAEKTKILDDELTRVKFTNGAILYVRQNTYHKDQIHLMAYTSGGTKTTDFQEPGINRILLSALNMPNRGMIARMLQPLREEGKKIEISAFIEENSHGYYIDTNPEDLESALKAIYLLLEYQKNPFADFHYLNDCSSFLVLNSAGFKKQEVLNHGYFQDMSDTLIQYLSLLYQSYFGTSRNYKFVCSGNVNTLIAISRSQKYLGNLRNLELPVDFKKGQPNPFLDGIKVSPNSLSDNEISRSIAFQPIEPIVDRSDWLGIKLLAKVLEIHLNQLALANDLWAVNVNISSMQPTGNGALPVSINYHCPSGQCERLEKVIQQCLEDLKSGEFNPSLIDISIDNLRKELWENSRNNRYLTHLIRSSVRQNDSLPLEILSDFDSLNFEADKNLITLLATSFLEPVEEN